MVESGPGARFDDPVIAESPVSPPFIAWLAAGPGPGKDGWLGFCKQLNIPPIRIYAEAQSKKKQVEFDTVLFLLYAAWKIPKMKAGKGKGSRSTRHINIYLQSSRL